MLHVVQGLIKLTTAWLRRMQAMICSEAANADPCIPGFQDFGITFGCKPLAVNQYQSLRDLLPRVPVFVSSLGQYAAAHAAEIVPDSAQVRSAATPNFFQVSKNLHRAMNECVDRCVVSSPTSALLHWCIACPPLQPFRTRAPSVRHMLLPHHPPRLRK